MARWDEWAHKRPRDYRALINLVAVDTVRELPRRVAFAWRLPARLPWLASRKVLNACGLSDAFEYVVSGEQFKESKTRVSDIYLHALDLLGLPANRCCCVEDSVPGITAGKRARPDGYCQARGARFGFAGMPRTRLLTSCRSCWNSRRFWAALLSQQWFSGIERRYGI